MDLVSAKDEDQICCNLACAYQSPHVNTEILTMSITCVKLENTDSQPLLVSSNSM